MDRWTKLYRKMDRANRARRGSADRSGEEEWCKRVTSEVMEAIFAESLERAKAFEQETGSPVKVVYPTDEVPRQAIRVTGEHTLMTLSLGDAMVYLYSARSPNKLPAIHIASVSEQLRPGRHSADVDSSRPMHRRMMSTPVCRVVPRDDSSYELFSPDSKRTVDIDAVVFVAFEQLVKDWRRFARERGK